MPDTPTWRGRAPSPERGEGDGVAPVWDRPRDRQACLVLPPLPAEVLHAVERRGAAARHAEPGRGVDARRTFARRFPTPRGMALADLAQGAPAAPAPSVVHVLPAARPASTLNSAAPAGPAPTGLEHPVVLGVMVILLPPAGLLALWSSGHRVEAKWAVTGFVALAMVLGAMLGVVALR